MRRHLAAPKIYLRINKSAHYRIVNSDAASAVSKQTNLVLHANKDMSEATY
jgi:hypothetical protein